MKTYVITLERREDRRSLFIEHAEAKGIKYEFHYGVDGQAMKLVPAYQTCAGGLGCRAAHMQTMLKIATGEDDIGIILEDDARLDDRFEWADVLEVASKVRDGEVLFLNGIKQPRNDADKRGLFRAKMFRPTWSYVMTKGTAARLLNEYIATLAPAAYTEFQIDMLLDTLRRRSFVSTWLAPEYYMTHVERTEDQTDNVWTCPEKLGIPVKEPRHNA